MIEHVHSKHERTTISITVDKDILQAIEHLSQTLGMTLSAFTAHAFELAIRQQRIKELEEQHRQGYLKYPAQPEVILTEEDGMPHLCCVNLDHIRTVSRGKIGAYITQIAPYRMKEVQTALLFTLGFNEAVE